MNIVTIGLDLAKHVFQVHGIDRRGKPVLKKQLKRAQVLPFFANLEPCLVGMEACGGAHYWARKLETFGHTVKLMAPQFVKPYVKSNKTDAADAEGICEAVSRPSMRFVSNKTEEQQAVLALHRARQGFVQARTAQANQIRGLLNEFGLVIPQGIGHIIPRLAEILEDGENELPGVFRALMQRLGEHLKALDRQVNELEQQIQAWHRKQAMSRKLAEIPGIGPSQRARWWPRLAMRGVSRMAGNWPPGWGLLPRQLSSGGQQKLLGISKRGDRYLRTLLIHGTRAVIRVIERRRAGPTEMWLEELLTRRNKNVVAVALANKNARIVWALLTRDTRYRANTAAA